MSFVIGFIRTLVSLYSLAFIARVFLEMILGSFHVAVVFLRRITEPLLAPIRRYVRPIQSGGMAWDLAPMVALLLLWVVERVLILVLSNLAL